jgi:hypothetical protein
MKRNRVKRLSFGGKLMLSALVVFASFSASAYAAGSKTVSNQHVQHHSVAQDQYGNTAVIKPVKVKPAYVRHANKPQVHVKAAIHSVSAGGTLPFTGVALFKVALVGFGLFFLGFVLRRQRARE